MDELELYPRQAVIVKNGKIFVEDEPFLRDDSNDKDLDGYADNNNDDDHCKDQADIDSLKVHSAADGYNGKASYVVDDEDDFESEKENRISQEWSMSSFVTDHEGDHDNDDDVDDSDEDEDYDGGEAGLMRLVDREEFLEDVDGLRLQGLPDMPWDPALHALHDLHYLHSGQEVQRISVITALPTLLKENNAECMRRVVPKVREVLYVAQQDMQLAASSAFLQILQDKLVPLQNYTQTFLQTILTSVDSKDSEVAAAWLGTLLDVIDLLPTEIIKKDILEIAIKKGQLQQPVPVRLSCCKILGKIATKFDAFLIKKEILPVVQQLCQDVEHEVRACMCYQLDSVARGLGLENTKSAILPELVELTNDEESNVRITGLETVVNILSMLDNDTHVMTIVPLVCKFCQKAMQAEDSTLPAVAKQLGRFCHGLQGSLTDEQKQWFVDYYKKLCRVGLPDKQKASLAEKGRLSTKVTTAPTILSPYEDEDWFTETRHNAAYNFPAMATFVGVKHFKSELAHTLTLLCKDPHQFVRKTIASGFHEISKFMGHQVMVLFPDLITLLKDESIEVLQGVISSIPSSLEVLSRTGAVLSDAKQTAVLEVVNTFLAAEAVVFSSNCWRLQEDMMRHMSSLAKVCPQDLLYNRIVPILQAKMKHGRALPVRHAAARSLIIIIRNLRRLEQRDHLTHGLIEDFCHGRSCHSRGLFIVICHYFIELYSKAFFKEHLFEYVLSLTSDPVPNIRMRTCALLPWLKRQIKLPYDNALKGSLEQCVRKVLVNEKDRDVVLAMKQAVDEMDQIHVQMESVVSRRKNFEDDADDQVKEEEEKLLLEAEERERKEEEQRSSKGDKRNSVTKKDASKLPGPKKLSAGKGPTATNSKSDIPGRKDSKSSSSTATSLQPVCNGSPGSGGVRQSLLPHMIKSKSTTSIPSLSHIPRPAEGRPSTPPRKEAGSTRIPVYHSLPRSASSVAAGSSLNRTKASPTSQRMANIPNPGALVGAQQRKGSAGSLPSITQARRGSLGSASSTSSEPSTGRPMKPKTNSISTGSGGATLTVPKAPPARKITK